MKRLAIILAVMCLCVFAHAQHLAFSEELPIFEFEHYELTKFSRVCPNGNILYVYNMTLLDDSVPHIELFTSDYQPLWDKPIPVRALYEVAIRRDNTIAVLRKPSTYAILDSYNQAGERIEHLSNISIYNMGRIRITLVPDDVGGLHVIDKHGMLYRYINSAGELSDILDFSGRKDVSYDSSEAILADDGGVVFALSYYYNFDIYCIDSSHSSYEVLSYSSDELTGDLKLAKGADGSFYAGWTEGNSARVRGFSSGGTWSWDEPWIKAPSYAVQMEALAVSSLDRVIVHYQKLNEAMNNIRLGHHCVDLITLQGEPLYSHAPATLDVGEKAQHNSKIVIDDDGGWYFVAYKKGDYNLEPNNYILHFDRYCSPWTVAQHVPMWGLGSPVFHAFQEDNDLKLSYLTQVGLEYDDSYSELNYQKIDRAGNLSYPENGFQIKRGRRASNNNRTHLALKDGRLFVCWMHYYPPTLYYQVINPDGEKLYPEAQIIDFELATQLNLFETDDNGVMVTTKNAHYLEMHKIDLAKGEAWSEGGKVIECTTYSVYEGAILTAHLINDEIYVQRYVDGYPLWHGEGVLMAKINPEYGGNVLGEIKMFANNLIWGQYTPSYATMYFINSVTSGGLPRYKPDSAKAMVELTGDYVGCRVNNAYQDNGRWVFYLSLLYWGWGHHGGPSSPSEWMLHSDTMYQVYGDDVYPLYEINGKETNLLCVQDDAYFTYYLNHIYKYNIYNELVWDVQIPGYTLNKPTLLKDGRILWYGIDNASTEDPKLHGYGFVDQDGVIIYPDEPYISSLSIKSISITDHGVYFLMGAQYYRGWYLQYLPLKTWEPSQGGGVSVARIELKSYPNPFNPLTNISFILDKASETKLQIFNIKGQLVETIVDGYLPAGRHYWHWDATDAKERNLGSGVYFCRVKTKYQTKVIKLTLMK